MKKEYKIQKGCELKELDESRPYRVEIIKLGDLDLHEFREIENWLFDCSSGK